MNISENMTGNDFTVQEGPSPTEGEDEPEIMEQQIRDTPNMKATEGPAHRELENSVIKNYNTNSVCKEGHSASFQ